jgi:hypothetical protein
MSGGSRSGGGFLAWHTGKARAAWDQVSVGGVVQYGEPVTHEAGVTVDGRNEECWILHPLSSVLPAPRYEILVFDNGSEDRTVDIVGGMQHLGDKLVLFQGSREQENGRCSRWRGSGALRMHFQHHPALLRCCRATEPVG